MTRSIRLLLAGLTALVLTACGAASQPSEPGVEPMVTPTVETMPEPTSMTDDGMMDEAMPEPTSATDDGMMDEATPEPTSTSGTGQGMDEPASTGMGAGMDGGAMGVQPAWQSVALTDARSGASFTLGDFAGRTVFVEPMATWCSKCREQMHIIRDVRAQLDPDEVVFIGLSVETNISAAELARYVDEQGFDWMFAVMSPELLQELAGVFGRTIANPPSTPHFVIRPDGSVSELTTGIKPAEALLAELGAAREGTMP